MSIIGKFVAKHLFVLEMTPTRTTNTLVSSGRYLNTIN